jgi:choice-of-anchor A domain-containing protein/LPXTG-motif cell wall-anchored protein
MTTTSSRAQVRAIATTLLALGLVLLFVAPAIQADELPGGVGPCLPADPPDPVLPNCPPPQFPPFSSPSPVGIDNNVNVLVGGDFSITEGAAEAEGLVVVLGAVTLTKTAQPGDQLYNIGVVGVGSHIVPISGNDFFVVGGTTTTADNQRIEVGTGAHPGKFRHAGAVVSGSGNSGVVTATSADDITDPQATDSYLPLRNQLTEASTAYATYTPTGSVTNAGFESVFTGTNDPDLEIFEVAGNLTNGGGAGDPAQDLRFEDVDSDATVLINVLGTSPVINETSFVGLPDLQNVLWNFPEATDVQILGSSQFQGALLAGVQTGTLTLKSPGQNGRVFAMGSLVHGGTGSEIHNYSTTTPNLPPATTTTATTTSSTSTTSTTATTEPTTTTTTTTTAAPTTRSSSGGTTPTSGTTTSAELAQTGQSTPPLTLVGGMLAVSGAALLLLSGWRRPAAPKWSYVR